MVKARLRLLAPLVKIQWAIVQGSMLTDLHE